jgi:hypothetical protein
MQFRACLPVVSALIGVRWRVVWPLFASCLAVVSGLLAACFAALSALFEPCFSLVSFLFRERLLK